MADKLGFFVAQLPGGAGFSHSPAGPYMPWLPNTFWHALLSLALFCCRHCWTAESSANCCRQKRDASRLHASCSWGEPMCPCANEDEMPDSRISTAGAKYRIVFSVAQ